jgi:hypothetical protein
MQVLPLLRARVPDAQLELVGADVWLEMAKGHAAVRARGVVADLKSTLRKV